MAILDVHVHQHGVQQFQSFVNHDLFTRFSRKIIPKKEEEEEKIRKKKNQQNEK